MQCTKTFPEILPNSGDSIENHLGDCIKKANVSYTDSNDYRILFCISIN